MEGSISISAEFGGRDAAEALLPHFHALKRAASRCTIPKFPFPEFAFILRVDGEISVYGPPGIGHLDIDGQGRYISLDISISCDDRTRLGPDDPRNPIALAVLAAGNFLRTASGLPPGLDVHILKETLLDLEARYRAELAGEGGVPPNKPLKLSVGRGRPPAA